MEGIFCLIIIHFLKSLLFEDSKIIVCYQVLLSIHTFGAMQKAQIQNEQPNGWIYILGLSVYQMVQMVR